VQVGSIPVKLPNSWAANIGPVPELYCQDQ
jgi:hypothetical protein